MNLAELGYFFDLDALSEDRRMIARTLKAVSACDKKEVQVGYFTDAYSRTHSAMRKFAEFFAVRPENESMELVLPGMRIFFGYFGR